MHSEQSLEIHSDFSMLTYLLCNDVFTKCRLTYTHVDNTLQGRTDQAWLQTRQANTHQGLYKHIHTKDYKHIHTETSNSDGHPITLPCREATPAVSVPGVDWLLKQAVSGSGRWRGRGAEQGGGLTSGGQAVASTAVVDLCFGEGGGESGQGSLGAKGTPC